MNAITEAQRTVAGILADALRGASPPGLVSAYLFGSHAEARAHRESDVDLGILLRRDAYRSARERFEERLRLSAALTGSLPGSRLDVVILNDAPPLLARRIATRGRRVFCADADADRAFVRDVQLRAADLEPFLRRTRRVKLASLGR
jgi:predicted nucleotidyltransferase